MHIFKDRSGTEWTLDITVAAIKRVKALSKEAGEPIDLTRFDEPAAEGQPPLASRLTVEPLLLCDIIFWLVKPDADRRDVVADDFAAVMGGEALGHAFRAFWEEITDFFRQLNRSDLVKLAESQKAVLQTIVDERAAEIEAWQKDCQAEHQPPVDGSSSTGSPESSESTPTPSP